MKKSTWISIIDVLAFVCFVFLIATGILIKYGLPPGSRGMQGAGQGWRSAEKMVALVWGLDRHQWGEIHFWMSVLFLLAIAIHLFIHRKWIIAGFKGKTTSESRLLGGIGVAALFGLILIGVAIVMGPREEIKRSDHIKQHPVEQSRVE